MSRTFQARVVVVLILFVAAGCQTRIRQARKLIEEGSLGRARTLLANELETHSDDENARLLLGEVELRAGDIDRAKAVFAPLLKSDAHAWRVGQVYRDSVHRIELSGDAALMANEATEAVRLNSLAAPDMCKALLGRARRDQNGQWWDTVGAASRINDDCRRQTIALLRSWIPTATGNRENLVRITDEVTKLDPTAAGEMADVVRENTPMDTTGVPAVEDSSGSPVAVTIAILRELGECATMYRRYNRQYPVTNSFPEAWSELRPYQRTVNTRIADAWGMPLEYTSNGRTARIESGGPDRLIGTRADNIVWENGNIVQPVEMPR